MPCALIDCQYTVLLIVGLGNQTLFTKAVPQAKTRFSDFSAKPRLQNVASMSCWMPSVTIHDHRSGSAPQQRYSGSQAFTAESRCCSWNRCGCHLATRMKAPSIATTWSTQPNSRMMYHDVSWCIMMYHDVSWCIMMYHDVSWCIMMYHDVSCMMYHDVSCPIGKGWHVCRSCESYGLKLDTSTSRKLKASTSFPPRTAG